MRGHKIIHNMAEFFQLVFVSFYVMPCGKKTFNEVILRKKVTLQRVFANSLETVPNRLLKRRH